MDINAILYGATGYTGQLIAEAAKNAGLSILLSGRNEEKLKRLSDKTGFPYLAVDLNDAPMLEEMLAEVSVVLHAAGPFSQTAKPMVEACLETHTHYLDITGEIEVFEYLKSLDEKAKESEIMIMPGVGFDVVPTDCISVYLKKLLPDAQDLNIWIGGMSKVSPGTAKTAIESVGKATLIRRDGILTSIKSPIVDAFDFGKGEESVISINWGDIATAYFSTGIPNITVYFRMSRSLKKMVNMSGFQKWFLSLGLVQAYLKSRIEKRISGPTEEERRTRKTLIFAEVKNAKGEKRKVKLETPDGYSLTADISVNILKKVLNENLKPGFQTPAGYYGSDLILEVDGVKREIVLEE